MGASTPDQSGTLNARDLAKSLGVGRDTIYVWLRNGVLPGHRIGASWIVFAVEFNRWMQTRSNPGNGPTDVSTDELLGGLPLTLTYTDLMHLFGCSKRTIYSWLQDGVLPSHRVGRRWVTYREDVAALLQRSSNQVL